MRRTLEEAGKTRERIFQAGLKVFGDHGYSATRMEDIAHEAGTTRGAIYWHFKNKDDFFREVYDRVRARTDSIVEEALRRDRAREALRSAMVTVLSDFVEDEEWRLMFSLLVKTSWLEQARQQARRAHHKGGPKGFRARFEARIRRWTARGELRPVSHPAVILQAVWAYMWGLISMALEDEGALTRARVIELVDLFLAGITPGEERTVASRRSGGRAVLNQAGGRV